MSSFLKEMDLVDVLILIAGGLSLYLVYVYLSKKGFLDDGLKLSNLNSIPIEDNNRIHEKHIYYVDPVLNNNIKEMNNSENRLVNSVKESKNNNMVSNKAQNEPRGREKLRAANKKGNHLLLNKSDVKDKSNYICNKECPCDERTIGESLEDIRKQFLNPTQSFYGNVQKMKGALLDDGFKTFDGKEHNCHLKKMDENVINNVLGCNKANNNMANNNMANNNMANNNMANKQRPNKQRPNKQRPNKQRPNKQRPNKKRPNNYKMLMGNLK